MRDDIKITKGIKINTMSRDNMRLMTYNSNFCSNILNKSYMPVLSDDNRDINSKALIYDVSKIQSFNDEVLQNIIDLLLQLRASQSDQNVFIQNNTVVRQQIISQLKNELLKVQNTLSKGQVQKLQVISSDSFDEDTLNDILNSLLKESKKKSEGDLGLAKRLLTRNIYDNLSISSNIFTSHTKLINLQERYREIVDKASQEKYLERPAKERKLVNLIKPNTKSIEPYLYHPSKMVEDKKNINEQIEKSKFKTEILHSVQEITKLYKQKEFVNRHILSLQKKSVDFELYKDLHRRNLNYFIQRNIKNRYEKSIENYDNRTISTRLIKESNLINKKVTNEIDEEESALTSKVLDITKQTRNIKKHIDKNEQVNHKKIEDILINETIRNNVLDVYDKVISKNVARDIINRLVSKSISKTYGFKNIHEILEHTSNIQNIHKTISRTDKSYIDTSHRVNIIDAYNINRNYLKAKKDIVNKYNIKSFDFAEQENLSRIVNKINLVNKDIKSTVNLQETESQIDKVNKIVSQLQYINRSRKKIFNTDKIDKINKTLFETYTDFYNNKKINTLKINEYNEKNKNFDRINLTKREILLQSQTESKETLVKDITDQIIKTTQIKDYKKSTQHLKNIDHTNILLNKTSVENVKINTENIKKNLFNKYINNITDRFIKKENLTFSIDNIRNDIINRVKEKQTIYKDIVRSRYNEVLVDRNIQKVKNIFIKPSPTINYEEIESTIKTTSQSVLNKTLNDIRKKHNKRFIIDENKVINVINENNKISRSPLVVKENIISTDKIEKIISKNSLSVLSPEIKRINTHKTNDRNLYREVNKVTRSYFNDIQESIGERILLNRNEIINNENVYRDIKQDSIIYKTPISLKEISKKFIDNKKERKISSKSDYPKRSQNEHVETKVINNYMESKSQVAQLKKEDVIDMIKSYMSGIDVETISEAVFERVEEEMLSQRRRNGIL